MYLSSPMQFSSIIGQKETIAQLRSMVEQSRLSHALLFLGKEGTGALPLALAFAQYLVCEKVQGPGVEKDKAPVISLFGEEPMKEDTEDQPFPADSCGICPFLC